MKKYLDPKNDLVFKRIFGTHPNLLRALLNALLPLEPDERIVDLEYLPAEHIPAIPLLKPTLVDVRCRDERGRHFIVEMQMNWTKAFMPRVLFNASAAYVQQLRKGQDYTLLQPVIGLSLLNDIFIPDDEAFLHHYKMVNVANTGHVIKGLQLVFVELPKFHPKGTKEAQELWLRFLRETGGDDEPAPEDIRGANQELDEAMNLAEEAAYTRDELDFYNRYWDSVSGENTLLNSAVRERKEGRQEGRKEGLQEGLQEGRKEGLQEGMDAALQRLIASGMAEADARKLLGL